MSGRIATATANTLPLEVEQIYVVLPPVNINLKLGIHNDVMEGDLFVYNSHMHPVEYWDSLWNGSILVAIDGRTFSNFNETQGMIGYGCTLRLRRLIQQPVLANPAPQIEFRNV